MSYFRQVGKKKQMGKSDRYLKLPGVTTPATRNKNLMTILQRTIRRMLENTQNEGPEHTRPKINFLQIDG